MSKAVKQSTSWNGPILALCAIIYIALLVLFAWQTWQFVVWLFPDDALLFRILTLLSFDILAAIWAGVHTFYHFGSRPAKTWVQICWAVTFIFSLVASVLYLVLLGFFRFHIAVTSAMVDVGYAVCIFSLVLNILGLMAYLILEYRAAHPRVDLFEQETGTELTSAEVVQLLDTIKKQGYGVRELRALITQSNAKTKP